ncbi:hypothetical protein [Leuconostoc mesenteroides]|uniref:hypothetical protein n=1 Tax=Leuconostoc mesenteroides TaxID=1245 RepID=UPI000CFA32DA|nr:hypothetical protein [Leuconostoc mesenteroides]
MSDKIDRYYCFDRLWLLVSYYHGCSKKNIFNDVLPSKETAAKDLEILNIAIMLGQTGGHGYVGVTAIVFAFIECIFIQIIRSTK